MNDIYFNGKYLTSNRGVCKLIQIILGFAICAILCANWYGGLSCFNEGRIGFASGLNFVTIVLNIFFFLLNLFNIQLFKLEQLYNVLGVVLFLISIVLVIWYMIAWSNYGLWFIVTVVALIVIFVLFQWDFKSNSSLLDDHLPI